MSVCWPLSCISTKPQHKKEPCSPNASPLQLSPDDYQQPAEKENLYLSPDSPRDSLELHQKQQSVEQSREADLIDWAGLGQAIEPKRFKPIHINWRKGAALLERLRQADPAIVERMQQKQKEGGGTDQSPST